MPGSRFVWMLVAAAAAGGLLARPSSAQFGPPGGYDAYDAVQRRGMNDGAARDVAPVYGPTGPQKLVTEVRIVGNQATPLSRIQAELRTRQDRLFDPELVQADVRRLAATNLFRDVKTYTQETPQGVSVTFEVFERPTIQYIKFIGNRGISDRALRRKVTLKVGEPLNRYDIEENRRKLQEYYYEKGYQAAEVEIFEGGRSGDRGVVFLVSEGELQKIWSVSFIGNQVATDARLMTQIQAKPRTYDPLRLFTGKVDVKKIEEDVDRLTAYYRTLGYFRARVGRELEYGPSGEWLSIRYVIDEGPRYQVRNVSFVGHDMFAEADLRRLTKLQSGEYFHQQKMAADVQVLKDLYGGYGHIFANIQADPRFLEEPGQLDLIYRIDEGDLYRVGQINVNIGGEYPHTRRNVVLNRLSLRPGDIVDLREIEASKRRLRASQLFETNPAAGVMPEIVVKPPSLDRDPRNVAAQPGERPATTASIRGQSPEAASGVDPRTGRPVRTVDLDVYGTPRSGAAWTVEETTAPRVDISSPWRGAGSAGSAAYGSPPQ